MSGDDLSIALFIAGTGIAFGLTGLTVLGRTRKALFWAAAALIVAAGFWLQFKALFPPLAGFLLEIASRPTSWFYVVLLCLAAIIVSGQRLRRGEPQVASPTSPAPRHLTDDQRAFRIALKQFALTFPQRLSNLLGRARGALIARIKTFGDKDYSYALHHAMHFAWSSGSQQLARINELASLDSDQMDVDRLQQALSAYFHDYQWDQKSIANLNVLAKMSLNDLPETLKWLAADKDCWSELDKLKVWPEAAELKKITEDKMAFPGVNWTAPYRVNF